MFDVDPILLIISCAIVKCLVIGLALKISMPKPILPFIAIFGFLTAFYTLIPNKFTEMPEELRKTSIRFYFLLPVSTLLVSIWVFKKTERSMKTKVFIVGLIDALVTLVYVLYIAQGVLSP
ncbi:MAG: hypothetical protein KIT34_05200 [Cyanobacteria bacterium TGS_CYA1]|nr:hypothetical protein [Cyanobacteria bacterium TGS_CYA1]